MWVGLKKEITETFARLEGCLGYSDREDMSVLVDETPERREYKTGWARDRGAIARAEKRAKRERALELLNAGVSKSAVARELGVHRLTVARWAA